MAAVRGATLLTYGTGTGLAPGIDGKMPAHADAGIVRVDGDRLTQDPGLHRGLPRDTDASWAGLWGHPLGHVKGQLQLVGHWPDAALLLVNEWENTGQGLGPDLLRWRRDHWERRPSNDRAQLLALLPWTDGGLLAAFWKNAGNADTSFVTLDADRWFLVSHVPAFSEEAVRGEWGWPADIVAFRGDLFIPCAKGDKARVAHFTQATGKWEIRSFPGAARFDVRGVGQAGVAVMDKAGPVAFFDGTAWWPGASAIPPGLPGVPSLVVSSTSGRVEWAITDKKLWRYERGGAWSAIEVPGTAAPVLVAEGGAGDVWVRTGDGAWLRDAPLDGVYACSTDRPPGTAFTK